MNVVLRAGRILAAVQMVLGLALRLLDVFGHKLPIQAVDYLDMKESIGIFFILCGCIGLAATHPSALNFKYKRLYVPLTSVVLNIIGSLLAAAIPIAALLATFHGGLSLTSCKCDVTHKDVLSRDDPTDSTALLVGYITDVLIGMILLGVSVVAVLINWDISSCDETDLIQFQVTLTEVAVESSSGLDDLEASSDRPPSYDEMALATFSEEKTYKETEEQHETRPDGGIVPRSEKPVWHLTEAQHFVLEQVFRENTSPDAEVKLILSQQLDLHLVAVEEYFAVRRESVLDTAHEA